MLVGLLRRVLAPAVVAVVAAGPAPAQDLNLYTYMSVATTPAVRGITKMTEQIAAESGDRVKVRVHLGGSLQISATNIAAAVSDGVVQMADDAFFAGFLPVGDVLRLPMLIRNDAEYAKAAAILEPYVVAGYAKRGIVFLASYAYPKQQAYSRRKLTSLEEIKGQKLRVTSPEQGEFVKRFGGTPITMGTPEVPSAVDRGVIDGFFTASSGAGYTWKDLIKYEYTIGINYVNANIIVNKASWEKLSPADQAIVRKAAAAAAQGNTDQMIREEADYTQKMVDGGMTLTQAAAADVTAAENKLKPYWEEWAKAKGADATEVLGKIRAALGRS